MILLPGKNERPYDEPVRWSLARAMVVLGVMALWGAALIHIALMVGR